MRTFLKLLSFLTVILLSAACLAAQVIYTDVVPDRKLQGSSSNIWDNYEINLNNTGQSDFILTHFYPSDNLYYTEIQSYNFQDCDMLVDENDHPLALHEFDEIGPEQAKWLKLEGSAIHVRDNWRGQVDKYLGVRLNNSEGSRYGWIRMDIPEDESYCILKGFACRSTYNQSILAGEGAETDVDEEGVAIFQIYPNPASDRITISMSHPKTNNDCLWSKIRIYNAFGECVWSGGAGNELSKSSQSIDISWLPKGVYYLYSMDGTGRFVVE